MAENRVTLTMRVAPQAIECLDRIAAAADDSTAQLMVWFFESLRGAVEVLGGADGEELDTVRDKLAKVLLTRAPEAQVQAFQPVASIESVTEGPSLTQKLLLPK